LADFIPYFFVAQLHACVLCIALPAGLAVVLTWGFYFVFVVFRKQMLWLEGGSKG